MNYPGTYRFGGIVLMVVACAVAVSATTSTTLSQAGNGGRTACGKGTTTALIAGKHVCLRTGLACVRRLDAQYRRYGFSCPSRKLVRPFLMRDLGDLSGLGESLDNAEINAQGQIIGSVLERNGGVDTPFLWQNGTLTRLGTTVGKAVAINDAGQIVGWHVTAPNIVSAFLWQNGTITDLDGLGGISSGASAINEQGEIVGYSRTPTGETHAVLWANGTITDLGTLGGKDGGASAINNHGQIVGDSTTASGTRHGFLWQNGVMSDLTATDPRIDASTLDSDASGINDSGQILGNVWDTNTEMPYITGAGVFWEAGKVSLIGRYGSGYGDNLSSTVHAINQQGQIIGSTFWDGQFPWTGAFLWQHGRTNWLGGLGGRFDAVDALNDDGQSVGKSDTAAGLSHACLWDKSAITDLGTLGGKDGEGAAFMDSESEAFAINNHDQIAGASMTTGGLHLVLWTARP